ncbi:MAG: 3-oxoacyl-[acyl-carrier-protein] reductase [Acidobacteria bacterium]|nr:3-oxoacyl-[acyl-carrier-protein] reductase [Acidobacteriota bacterium]
MGEFSGKTALITGGSRGIGFAVASRLARNGCTVHLMGRNPERLERSVAGIRDETGATVEGIVADLGDEKSLADALREISRKDRSYQFLVNNAGIARDGLVLRMRLEQWDEVMRVNLTAAFRITRAVLPAMVKARCGKVVNITSVVALMGNPGQANYVASKAGMIGFTKSLAREIGSRGITVNAVAPGLIETDMTANLQEGARRSMTERIPLGRVGLPAEVAAGVCFLLSGSADYITGEVLNISGGLYM